MKSYPYHLVLSLLSVMSDVLPVLKSAVESQLKEEKNKVISELHLKVSNT